ncbi:MAG: fibronectin type III domain-containing protein, partial [Planctomycetota bacterium]
IGYTFSVTATTAIGSSEASANSEVATPAKAPSAPNLIRLQQSSATSVLATWETPSDFGGSFVKSYTVLKSDGTTACTAPVDDNDRSCNITGLTSGTRYTYTVTAMTVMRIGGVLTLAGISTMIFLMVRRERQRNTTPATT